jgi:hypothetical protein
LDSLTLISHFSSHFSIMFKCSWRLSEAIIGYFCSCGATAQRGLWPPNSRGFLDHTHDAPQSVGFLWMSDPVAETSTRHHTTLATTGTDIIVYLWATDITLSSANVPKAGDTTFVTSRELMWR